MNYVTIDIHVTNDDTQPETYLVAATTKGRRTRTEQATFHLPSTFREDLEPLLRKLHARTLPQEDERNVQSFGEDLFNALIRGDVRTLYDERLKSAQQNGSGLQLCLHIRPPELIVLPWEILYDKRQPEGHLCLTEHPKILILRRPAHVTRTRPAKYDPPLRVLLMAASPRGLLHLEVEQEEQDIREALQQLVDTQQVEIETKPGTIQALEDLRLGEHPIHTYHFLGHGTFDPQRGEGQLVFENENRTPKRISVAQFRRSLPTETQLVVLNACQTAQGNESNHFSSIAASLASRGIPAVVAMQFKISDPAAVRFAKIFYTSLAKGLGVDEAVAEARLGIATADRSNHLDWAAPVLYMGSSNPHIFVKKTTTVETSPITPDDRGVGSQGQIFEPWWSKIRNRGKSNQPNRRFRLIAAVLGIVLLSGLLARFAILPLINMLPPATTLCVATDLPKDQPTGLDILQGAQLALKNSPLSTGYSGNPLSIDYKKYQVVLDPLNSSEKLQNVFNDPHCPNPIAVIGPYDSQSAQQKIPDAADLHILLLSPSNTASCLTQQTCLIGSMKGGKSTYLRLTSTDDYQAKVDANFLAESKNPHDPLHNGLGAQKIDIVENSDIYGTGLASQVQQDLSSGYPSTSTKLYCIRTDQSKPPCSSESDAKPFTSTETLANQILTDNPDAVFFAGLNVQDAGNLLNTLHSQSSYIPFVGGSSLVANATMFFDSAKISNPKESNIYATVPVIDPSQFTTETATHLSIPRPILSPDAQNFSSGYKTVSSGYPPGAYSANGYDAVNIILQAIEWMTDHGESVNPATLLSQMRSGTFQGLFEQHIQFDSSGNNKAQPWYTIYQCQQNQQGDWNWQFYIELQPQYS